MNPREKALALTLLGPILCGVGGAVLDGHPLGPIFFWGTAMYCLGGYVQIGYTRWTQPVEETS